uniref:Protein quiver n=1 Tax=Anopheles farauti TaxID=69004 RepID=A0A182QY06_9DIPT
MAYSRGDSLLAKVVFTLTTVAVLTLGLHNAGVSALRCHHCGWETCGSHEELVECNVERVNQVHESLKRLVNLTTYETLSDYEEFACFELRLTNVHGNRSGTVKSCTIQSAKMCEITDWRSVKVVGCETCNEQDYCNGFNTLIAPKIDKGAGFSFSMYRSSGAATSVNASGVHILCSTLTALLVAFVFLPYHPHRSI